jgi:hypothetical protein
LPVRCATSRNSARLLDRPKQLDEMLGCASGIGSEFSYVRVDLYNVGNKVLFGELTFYPFAGYDRFKPKSWDVEIGRQWSLSATDQRNSHKSTSSRKSFHFQKRPLRSQLRLRFKPKKWER